MINSDSMQDEEDTERIRTRNRTLFVLGCVLVVLLIAFLLPFLNFSTPVQDDGEGSERDELLNDSPETNDDSQAGPDERNSSEGPNGVPERIGLVGDQREYHLEFNRSIVPGSGVRITVLDGGTPIEDVPVATNGQVVGRTDQFGEVVAEVPYTSHFNVTALKPAYRGMGSVNPASLPTNRTIRDSRDLPTRIRLAANREPRPDETHRVTAHIEGVRVRNATVLVDGDRAGRTDGNGRYSFQVPRAAQTNVTVTHGAAEGTRTWDMAPLTVTVHPAPFSSPTAGQQVTVVATQDGRPVDAATVRLDGERVGSTDTFGTHEISLPWASSASLEVSKGRLETTRKLTGLYGLYWELGLILFGGLVGIVLLGAASLRVLGRPDSRSFVSVAIRMVVGVVVSVADGVLGAIDRLRDAVGAVRREFTPTLAGVRGVLLLVASAVRSTIRGVVARIRGVVTRTRRPFEAAVQSVRDVDGPSTNRTTGTAGGDGTDATERIDVRQAWSELVSPVVRRPESRPPRELAAAAARRGAPERAATTLADAYRDVVYGQRDADEYVSDVRESLAEVRDARSTDGDGEQSTGEGENAA